MAGSVWSRKQEEKSRMTPQFLSGEVRESSLLQQGVLPWRGDLRTGTTTKRWWISFQIKLAQGLTALLGRNLTRQLVLKLC